MTVSRLLPAGQRSMRSGLPGLRRASCRRRSTRLVEYCDPGQRARSVRPDGAGLPAARRAAFCSDTEHLHRDWTLAHEYGLTPAAARDVACLAARGRRRASSSPPRARRRRSSTCAISRRRRETAHRGRGRRDGRRGPARAGGRRGRASPKGTVWPAVRARFRVRVRRPAGPVGPAAPQVSGGGLQNVARRGIRVVMITGDYPATARAIALRARLGRRQARS